MAGLVTTEWLAENLGREDLRILDTRGKFSPYEEGHIPGAQMLNIETLRMSNHGMPCMMMPLPMLATIFGRLGIRIDTPVAIYAEDPTDHVSSTFTAWNLAVTGNPNVCILDGDMEKWIEERRPVTQQYPRVEETDYVAQFDSSLFADWQYVRDHLHNPDVVIVDTRTRGMYEGTTGPTQRLGHIPGAVLHNYLWDFTRKGTYRPIEEMERRYHRAGITQEKEIITYCVTGREGSAVWFVLKYILGYPRVRLYQASMTEWSAHPELPIEVSGRAKAA